ncbi:hypothetical protein [Candidatus Burkholderia verschuerenii]|nr:hypothetical protein [Candidatus Burkholderia verschuerenii]
MTMLLAFPPFIAFVLIQATVGVTAASRRRRWYRPRCWRAMSHRASAR